MTTVHEIVQQLKIASKFYYDGKPILTDAEFDELENKLRAMEPYHDYFNNVGTPTTRGVKVKHRLPMGSLDQLNETNDIVRWFAKFGSETTIILSHKLDGNSVAIYYDGDGNFESAVTRGDGIEGLDITRHVRRMLTARPTTSIPSFFKPNGVVRCEAIMNVETFNSKVTGYKNPRNYVAGQLNRTVADQTFIDCVDFVAFDMVSDTSKHESLQELVEAGFNTVKWTSYAYSRALMNEDWFTTYLKNFKAESVYELDGVVVEINDRQMRDRVGFTHLNPNYAFKFKINQTFVDTECVRVIWRASKDGYLKPRVEFEPIDLAGVTISFATGFNAKFIQDNGIGPGAVIRVTRSGDVIPFIQSVIAPATASMPDNMDQCDWTESGVDLVLKELPDSSHALGAVDFFTSVGAPLLKEGNVNKLFEAGFDSISSIVQMTEDQMIVVLGENGTKVYLGLREKLAEIDEYVLLGSLPFIGRGIGKRKMKKLAEVYGKISDLTEAQILAVDGFEATSATKILDGLVQYKEWISELGQFISVKTFERVSGDLNGTVVCFTGVRNAELEKAIEGRGGKISNTLSKAVTHLVAKNPAGKSTKLDSARARGVEVISIEEAKGLWSN